MSAGGHARRGPATGAVSAVRLVVLAAVLAGCGGGATATSSSSPGPSGVAPLPSGSSGSGGSASAEVVSPVTGVVVAIESSGLEDVTGFTLRSGAGVTLNFRIAGPLENAAEFPLGHLGSHVATSEPVRVSFRRTGGALVVTRIEDAD